MSADIHSLDEARPHTYGKARCLGCGHEWEAVVPAGVAEFECPGCHLEKGVRVGLVYPTPFWECGCGSSHFCINDRLQPVCVLCGLTQVFDD
jgi:hypothetical protein